MLRPYSPLEHLTGRIIRCAIEVHRVLGPGLLESVYVECLETELRRNGLTVQRSVRVPIIYKTVTLTHYLEVDLMIEGQVVVEAKAVDALAAVHSAQLLTCLC